MTSTWLATQHPTHEPLTGRTTTDCVVIGAGIVGATTAAGLAEQGMDVVLLDSGRIAGGATGHSSAKVSALQSLRHAGMERDHGPEAARSYATATTAAVELLAEEEPSFRRIDALTWSADERDREDVEAERLAMERAGLPVVAVEDQPDGLPVAHGLRLGDQGIIDPARRVNALVARLESAGGRVHEDSAVHGVSLTGERRVVTTEGGQVEAAHVVVATGLPILDRGLWWARTEPHRSYVVVLATDSPPQFASLRVSGGTRSARPVEVDGRPAVLVAGADHRTGLGGDTRQNYQQLAAWGRQQFGGTEVLAQWSAQDWKSADGLPLVGALVPRDHAVLAACGFDKWGLTSGTAAAATLQRLVLGQPLEDADRLFDPARLPGTGGAAALASNAATTGWEATRGWLRLLATPASTPSPGEGVVHRSGARPTATSNVDGTVRSCAAVCTHLGGTVRWEPGDQAWACPLHGSRFAPDGAVLSGPAHQPLAPRQAP